MKADRTNLFIGSTLSCGLIKFVQTWIMLQELLADENKLILYAQVSTGFVSGVFYSITYIFVLYYKLLFFCRPFLARCFKPMWMSAVVCIVATDVIGITLLYWNPRYDISI
eukprot:TRINITY_DN260_c0_g1_i2.p1 TRINITY_DN260_c0_g1~~TRINITY_DN260_c0_g1_i2.p1  ORF type:complete len:111 (-),score=1.52 TRINITY_DN260_c0_g1_i2:358-690(-)